MTSRIIVIVAIVAAVALGWVLYGSDRTVTLVSVETEREANAIQVALLEYGVVGSQKQAVKQKRATAWEIRVPREAEVRSKRVLVGLGYPRLRHSGFTDMLSNSALIPSRTDERARLMDAIAGELARTFETDEDIVSARVHVSVPPERLNIDGVADEDDRTSASVFLKYRMGSDSDDKAMMDGVPVSLVAVAAIKVGDGESAEVEGAEGEAAVGPDAAAETELKNTIRFELPGERSDYDGLPVQPDAVCKIVANAVEGLSPDRVTVVYRGVALPEKPDRLVDGDGAVEPLFDPVLILFFFAVSMLGTTIWFFFRMRRAEGREKEDRPTASKRRVDR